jgi:hypothetical protein
VLQVLPQTRCGYAGNDCEQVSGKAFQELKTASAGSIDERAQHVLWPALGGLATGAVLSCCMEQPWQGQQAVNLLCTSHGYFADT